MSREPLVIVIRVRGASGMAAEAERVLRLLNLKKANHAIILPLNQSTRGMLRQVHAYVTWGEASPEILAKLLKRGDPLPGVKVEEELKKLGVKNLEELSVKIANSEVDLSVLEKMFKPIFRLHPPRGGFKGSIKRPAVQDGVLGYAGERISRLIEVMS
ncbi:MAG: 50S ribosomal protein L30 [Nitrososphaerota archaeon]|nr:50S ribosomal protein L30 [Candidatus Calditenuaceae archaeon]MDW8072885.1 50S ribosomal protein L30 [Nitrososphaerota archaeon]